MASRTNGRMKKHEELKLVKEMGPNWVVIVGGALLCTLSIRLCCRLKQVFDFRSSRETSSKENGKSTRNKRHESHKLHSQSYCSVPDEDRCHHCCSGVKQTPRSPLSKDGDDSLPLVNVNDRLMLTSMSFNRANSSDSTCLSESGSDIYNKRDVIQKLRKQLKRRDDMILEMQAQITVLQNSLTAQTNQTSNLQAQLDSSNQNLLDSNREIIWLQKTISGMRLRECARPEAVNGHANGYVDVDLHWGGVEKIRGEDRVEVLKREIEELKEVIEGKEYLIESYREQKIGLCSKLNELQLILLEQASVSNIL